MEIYHINSHHFIKSFVYKDFYFYWNEKTPNIRIKVYHESKIKEVSNSSHCIKTKYICTTMDNLISEGSNSYVTASNIKEFIDIVKYQDLIIFEKHSNIFYSLLYSDNYIYGLISISLSSYHYNIKEVVNHLKTLSIINIKDIRMIHGYLVLYFHFDKEYFKLLPIKHKGESIYSILNIEQFKVS